MAGTANIAWLNNFVAVQNFLLWSEDFTQSGTWTNASGNIAILANAGPDAGGGNTMNLLTVTGGAGGDVNQIFNGLTPSTQYWVSWDATLGTNTGAEYAIWDWDNFTQITPSTSYIGSISGTVSRIQFTFTTHAANSTIKLIIFNAPFTNGTIYLGRAQVAASASAGYVTTTTSAHP